MVRTPISLQARQDEATQSFASFNNLPHAVCHTAPLAVHMQNPCLHVTGPMPVPDHCQVEPLPTHDGTLAHRHLAEPLSAYRTPADSANRTLAGDKDYKDK